MLPSWFNESVTVERAPWASVRGTTERDWANATPHTVGGCHVQPSGGGMEFGELRAQAVESDATLYAPPGADVQAGDRITCEMGTFIVDGDPKPWRSPTGGVSNVQAKLKTWRG